MDAEIKNVKQVWSLKGEGQVEGTGEESEHLTLFISTAMELHIIQDHTILVSRTKQKGVQSLESSTYLKLILPSHSPE